jgi:hypothetical protein
LFLTDIFSRKGFSQIARIYTDCLIRLHRTWHEDAKSLLFFSINYKCHLSVLICGICETFSLATAQRRKGFLTDRTDLHRLSFITSRADAKSLLFSLLTTSVTYLCLSVVSVRHYISQRRKGAKGFSQIARIYTDSFLSLHGRTQ